MSSAVDSLSIDVGTKAIDAYWQQANAISDNIANADTPGYHEKSVSFESALENAISDDHLTSSELSGVNAELQESPEAIDLSDGNGVDMESQMVELMRNQLQYNYLTRGVSGQLSLLKMAAGGTS